MSATTGQSLQTGVSDACRHNDGAVKIVVKGRGVDIAMRIQMPENLHLLLKMLCILIFLIDKRNGRRAHEKLPFVWLGELSPKIEHPIQSKVVHVT